MVVMQRKKYHPEEACEKAGMSSGGVAEILRFFEGLISEDKHPGAQLVI